jgi:hypothetical protein
MTETLATLLLLLVALLANAALAQNTTTIEQLYQAAKQEAALTIYAGGAAAPHERRAVEFEKRFPGIKVSVTAEVALILAPEERTRSHRLARSPPGGHRSAGGRVALDSLNDEPQRS